MKEHLAFLSIERSLGSLAWNAMAHPAAQVTHRVKAALQAKKFAHAHDVLPHVNFDHAAHAVQKHAEVYGKAAYLLGASAVYGGLRHLPRSVAKRIPGHHIERVLHVHSQIVSKRAEIIIRQSLANLIRKAQAAHHERGYGASYTLGSKLRITKAEGDDLIDQLNSAVDGNAQMMASLSANLTTSRLVSYGFLNEAANAGVREYMLQAVMDDRTSLICQALDGRTFQVQKSLDYMDSVLNASDPESLKTLSPFVGSSKADIADLEDSSDDELQAQGVMVPPFHPNCRTILVRLDDAEASAADIDLSGSLGSLLGDAADAELVSDAVAREAMVATPEEALQEATDQINGMDTAQIKEQLQDIVNALTAQDVTFPKSALDDLEDIADMSAGEVAHLVDRLGLGSVVEKTEWSDDTHDRPVPYGQWQAVLKRYHDLRLTLLRPVPVVRTEHVPYLAAAATNGGHAYIDPCVPKTIMLGGRPVEPDRYLVRHEISEWWLMTVLAWPYYMAHSYALTAEHQLLLDDGFTEADIADYEAQMKEFVHGTEHEAVGKVPHDMFAGPYEVDPDDLDKAVLAQLTFKGEKVTQKAAKYTAGPVDKEPCQDCVMFRKMEGGMCTKVQGKISPEGHCKFWYGKLQLKAELVNKDGLFVVRKNPYHDAEGHFTSADNVGSAAVGSRTARNAVSGKYSSADWSKAGVRVHTEVLDTMNKLGVTPKEFHDGMLGGHPGSLTVTPGIKNFDPPGSLTVSGGVREEGQALPAAVFSRSLDPQGGTAIHNTFEVTDQGKGLGKSILAGQVALYEKIGISSVSLTANCDVGSYAWAKYGFAPSGTGAIVSGSLTSEMTKRLDAAFENGDLKGPDADAAKQLIGAFRNGNNKALWAISDLTVPVKGVPLGKYLMLDSLWSGTLNLKDDQAMKRFNAYVGK